MLFFGFDNRVIIGSEDKEFLGKDLCCFLYNYVNCIEEWLLGFILGLLEVELFNVIILFFFWVILLFFNMLVISGDLVIIKNLRVLFVIRGRFVIVILRFIKYWL